MTPAEPASEEPEIVVGSREQLLHLLAEASEIEHMVMCSYLYAAFSLKRRGDDGLDQAEGDAVERWRKAILGVAIEEMGHLLMVANLTVAVGGRPHFARPNFPVSPGHFPSGLVMRLTGFSIETLDHFIFLERPRGADGEDAAPYEQDDYERAQAEPGLMPSAQDYCTIGHLYEAIRRNIEGLSSRIGERSLFLGGPGLQLGPELIDLEGIMTIDGLTDALAAIDMIVEQGEGSQSDRADSHFHAFIGIRDELSEARRANPAFQAAWPVAENPVLRQPPEPEDKMFIAHPEAARMLDFACSTYGLLLRILGQAFGRHGDSSARNQETLVGAAFDLMHLMGAAAGTLVRLPANREAPGVNAGMSFTMLRGVEPLLEGRSEEIVLREQLDGIAGSTVLPDAMAPIRALASEFRLDRS